MIYDKKVTRKNQMRQIIGVKERERGFESNKRGHVYLFGVAHASYKFIEYRHHRSDSNPSCHQHDYTVHGVVCGSTIRTVHRNVHQSRSRGRWRAARTYGQKKSGEKGEIFRVRCCSVKRCIVANGTVQFNKTNSMQCSEI